MVLGRIDELGRGAWIVLVILGFWIWWPVGLAVLALTFGRSRRYGGPGRWHRMSSDTDGNGFRRPFSGWGCGASRGGSSGHSAFDDYRTETLRRLEEEQREFVEYLEKLRRARDKSEFDAFMAERRNRQTPQAPMPDV